MTPSELFALLGIHSVEGDSALTLVDWLHELGDILFYRDYDGLNDIVMLQPEWVTERVAAVLDSGDVKRERGILSSEQLSALWPSMDGNLRGHLLRLMDHFDLMYNTGQKHQIGVVVECLQHSPTGYEQVWNSTAGQPEIKMRFELGPRLQPGIPTWFIARAHRFTIGHQWRTGALFEDPSTRSFCLMQADRSSVTLSVRGPNPAYYFGIMKGGFEDTLKEYRGLRIKRWVPCVCGGRDGAGCVHEFEYVDVMGALEAPEPPETLQCPKTFRNVPVSQILNGLHFDSQRVLLAIQDRVDQNTAALHAGFAEMRREFTLALQRQQNEIDFDCPGVFTLHPPRSGFVLESNWESWRRRFDGKDEELELCLYCEAHGSWHLTAHGSYRFRPQWEFLKQIAPYWKSVAGVLKLSAPLMKAAGKFSVPHLAAAGELVGALPDIADDRAGLLAEMVGHKGRPEYEWTQARATLKVLIEELDKARKNPAEHWGGLSRTLTPEGELLWLCPQHKRELYPFPRKDLD